MRRTWRIRKSCGEEEKDSFNFLREGDEEDKNLGNICRRIKKRDRREDGNQRE